MVCFSNQLHLNLKINVIPLLIITTIISQTTTQKSPWDTPLDELKYVQQNVSVCQNKSIQINIEPLELLWQTCITPFIPISGDEENSEEVDSDVTVTTEEEEKRFYSYFCRDPLAYKKCWEYIVWKLNECQPGKGDTSALIYFTMYDYSCRNNGTEVIERRIKASDKEVLCEHDYSTQICKDSQQEWYSADTCRRFLAQRKCDDSSISQCTNTLHKEFSEDDLSHIQRMLGCSHSQQEPLNTANTFLSSTLTYCISFLLLFMTNR